MDTQDMQARLFGLLCDFYGSASTQPDKECRAADSS
jgi:hypothetical protein